MKIKSIGNITATVFVMDNGETYTRYAPDEWAKLMGNGEEFVFNYTELETIYQEYLDNEGEN
ncbi:MAG: hypothetical protein ABIJ40_06730 [Bacteroidota bacterium]